jgi:photosystem II stability/assembly factor-like uncharacterized protein
MASESFEQRLRAYLDRRSQHAAGPGAVDRVMATAFEPSTLHGNRRRFATIAIAAAVALVVGTPITVLLLREAPRTTLEPPIRPAPSPRVTPPPSATTAPTHMSFQPKGVAFWDTKRGLLVASPPCATVGVTCPGGLIERTSNGGKTWHVVDTVPASLVAVALAGSDVAWVSAGASCGLPGSCTTSTLLRSTDDGTTWTEVLSATPVGSLSPTSAATAWAVAGTPGAPDVGTTLVHSVDGGKTWQQRSDPCSRFVGLAPWALSFAGAVHGWLICIGGPATDMQPKALFATHDGGATWQLESDTCVSSTSGHFIRSVGLLSCVGYLPVMSFLSDGHGWMYAGRGSLTATSNVGRTWAQVGANVVSFDVNAVVSLSLVADVSGFVLIDHSASYPACPAVGCGPELLATHDAGRTWTVVDSWTQ